MAKKENSLSTADQEKLTKAKQAIENQIDDFLKAVGFTDINSLIDDEGKRCFSKGSVQAIAFASQFKDQLFLELQAHIMQLPSDKELILPLFRQLLEMNMGLPGPARFGLSNDHVIVAMTMPAELIREGDVAAHINFMMNMADDMDDKLKAKFGGTSKKRGTRAAS